MIHVLALYLKDWWFNSYNLTLLIISNIFYSTESEYQGQGKSWCHLEVLDIRNVHTKREHCNLYLLTNSFSARLKFVGRLMDRSTNRQVDGPKTIQPHHPATHHLIRGHNHSCYLPPCWPRCALPCHAAGHCETDPRIYFHLPTAECLQHSKTSLHRPYQN